MNRGEVHEISMKLGQLSQAVSMMTDLWKSQEVSATAGRKALHQKFESLQQSVGAQLASLDLRVDRVVDTMSKIEPAVKKYEDEKLREEGAKRLGKGLIAAFTATAGAVGWGLHEMVGYLKH